MSVIIRNRQNLLDIAIQETGTIESVFELAKVSDISITEVSIPGTERETPETTVNRDSEVREYLGKRNISISTSSESDSIDKGGIGSMAIEIDFIIE